MSAILDTLWQSPSRELVTALGGVLVAVAIERVRQRLSRNEALISEAAKVRLAAYSRVLGALSPVAGLALVASAHGVNHDEAIPNDVVTEFGFAHERASQAVLADSLLVGWTTTVAVLGFLGFTERLFGVLKSTTQRSDPRRADVLSKVWPMIRSIEQALPRFAQLPRELHFRQRNLASVYTEVGVWMKKNGKYEIVNPYE